MYRKLLLFSSTVIFLALAPLVVFYAMGYRISSSPDEALPVGVLLVETTPRRAQLEVNGLDEGTSPQSVPNLPPGTISVDVTKEGYQDWHKEVNIEPAAVTELRSIRLFPKNLKEKMLLSGAQTFSLSPNRKLLAVLTSSEQLHIIDEAGLPIMPPVVVGQVERLLWSPDSNLIVLFADRSVRVVDVSRPGSPLAAQPLLDKATDIVWDPGIPGRLLILTNSGDLIAYQLATNTTVVLASSIGTFATSARNIYVVGQDNNISVLNPQGEIVSSLRFDQAPDIAQLLITPGGNIAFISADQSLAVLDTDNHLLPVAQSVLSAGWSPDGQLLYVQTEETALHVYNALDERLQHIPLAQLQLIIRLSRPIRDPQWFAGGHHLIYQVNDEIIITEIDTRDHPISYQVDTTNLGTAQPTVGKGGELIFYLKARTPGRTDLMVAPLIVD